MTVPTAPTSLPSAPSTSPLPSVFVLGDSISMQYGPFLQTRLAGRMRYARKTGEEAALRNLDVPAGANGGDSRMVLAFLRGVLADPGFRPDFLLLNCGLHDIKRDPATGALQVPLGEYGRNLRICVGLLVARGIRLVWVRTTPVDDAIHNNRPGIQFHRQAADVAAYNAAADAVMAQAGIAVADLHGLTAALGAPEAIFCDHVHFVESVRERQAEFLADFLLRLAAERPTLTAGPGG